MWWGKRARLGEVAEERSMLSIQSSEERASRGPCHHFFSVGRTDGGTPLNEGRQGCQTMPKIGWQQGEDESFASGLQQTLACEAAVGAATQEHIVNRSTVCSGVKAADAFAYGQTEGSLRLEKVMVKLVAKQNMSR